jgi:tripartite-type tricarboxylate transporter receptor subunit TctC
MTSPVRSAVILPFVCVLVAWAAGIGAQSYPAKPVRYITPTTGATEVVARLLAQGMSDALGQQVFVDVRAGAGGNIGAEIAARAPADGYTLLQITQSHTVNMSLYRNPGYDLMRDFAPVTKADLSPLMVVVHPSLPVKSVAELVKLARARPGAVNYASAGAGTSTFLAGELFKLTADVKLTEVPYRGGGPAVTAVVSGEVPLYFAPIATALPFIREGRLRALAMCTAQRSSLLPQLPTVAESGYPGFEASNWHGLAVPAKTPKEIVSAIHSAAIAALKKPDIARRMYDLGLTPIGDQPAEFAAFLRADIEKWRKIVRQRGLTVD